MTTRLFTIYLWCFAVGVSGIIPFHSASVSAESAMESEDHSAYGSSPSHTQSSDSDRRNPGEAQVPEDQKPNLAPGNQSASPALKDQESEHRRNPGEYEPSRQGNAHQKKRENKRDRATAPPSHDQRSDHRHSPGEHKSSRHGKTSPKKHDHAVPPASPDQQSDDRRNPGQS